MAELACLARAFLASFLLGHLEHLAFLSAAGLHLVSAVVSGVAVVRGRPLAARTCRLSGSAFRELHALVQTPYFWASDLQTLPFT